MFDNQKSTTLLFYNIQNLSLGTRSQMDFSLDSHSIDRTFNKNKKELPRLKVLYKVATSNFYHATMWRLEHQKRK